MTRIMLKGVQQVRRLLVSLFPTRLRRWHRSRSQFATPLEVERAEQEFYLSYLREGMTVIDAGASVGEMTLFFVRLIAPGIVHAFEPGEKCFARLRVVCDATGRRNVVLNQCALTEHPGLFDLNVYDDPYQNWNSLALRPLSDYGIEIAPPVIEKVPATNLDHYCRHSGLDRIDLLKIDVEGAEFQVLLGARRMLQENRVRCLAFEFGQATFDMGNDPREIKNYLTAMGYKIRNVVARDPLFPGGTSGDRACFSMHIAVPVANHWPRR